jgi:electron transfer flavoprotein alpha subunit
MTIGVLICAEQIDGRVTTTTRELLHAGRRLADKMSQPLGALLVGKNIQEAAKEVISLGADISYIVDAPSFIEASPDNHVGTIARACREIGPSAVLFGQTDMGRDVAPTLAAQLGTTVSMDCVNVDIDPDTKALLQTRPVYGGNAMAVWSSQGREPQIVAMRPRSMPAAEPDAARQGEIVAIDTAIGQSSARVELIETKKEEIAGIKLEDARIIVAGGGGIGGPEGFKILEELAHTVGGAVAATRVPCDEKWVSSAMEVGQTGAIVTPDTYIAVGISGAVQHMVGCSNAKRIVAINRDPDAHIFQEADFGMVGDYREAVPALTESIRKIKGL